ncbi:MAG: tRNA preQ1(34) S-adenosylmethionine ribosyltransferase-isomerase QueA [Chloroflexi bacterium]|nr:tRNA preQ1(34) S-adenosylmethionine ribosyltransferase-isomerase QueA [Chloroflexota bacterium]
MKTSDFDYDLPPELIAQEPIEPRDASRLLVLDRSAGSRQHRFFGDLPNVLNTGDLLVVNRSRVVPARLFAKKIPSGGKVELLLLEKGGGNRWKTLVGGKGLHMGTKLKLENGTNGEIIEDLGGPQRMIAFDAAIDSGLKSFGRIPLPPYIHTPLADPERYQTVYARESGSAAAPTAGLHFTQRQFHLFKDKGIRVTELTLHIGLDTFAPVNEEDPHQHKIHNEWCRLSVEAAEVVNRTKRSGGRVIAVGTTSVRVLETAARLAVGGKAVMPFEGRTDLFILPGFEFRVVDALLTNFHLPRSTLLMLVSAFAGRELILETYREAMANGYRFYSFGDAMLIV